MSYQADRARILQGILTQLIETAEGWTEDDTRAIAVEPVLVLLGWDILDYAQVRRLGHTKCTPDHRQGLDVELLAGGWVRVVMEVKTPRGPDFPGVDVTLSGNRLAVAFNSTRPLGALRFIEEKKGVLPGHWTLAAEGARKTVDADAIGQLRSDCLNAAEWIRAGTSRGDADAFLGRLIPVATNGNIWLAFHSADFLDTTKATRGVDSSMVAACGRFGGDIELSGRSLDSLGAVLHRTRV